jgi:dihydropteroate synthase
MGILNVTPDSFSDGGLYRDASKAAAHGEEMAGEGADEIGRAHV